MRNLQQARRQRVPPAVLRAGHLRGLPFHPARFVSRLRTLTSVGRRLQAAQGVAHDNQSVPAHRREEARVEQTQGCPDHSRHARRTQRDLGRRGGGAGASRAG